MWIVIPVALVVGLGTWCWARASQRKAEQELQRCIEIMRDSAERFEALFAEDVISE